jgi:hypothetical protein
VTVIGCTLLFSGNTEWLAGETTCEYIALVLVLNKVSCSYIIVLYAVWKMMFGYLIAKGVNLNTGKVIPPHPLCGYLKSPYAVE